MIPARYLGQPVTITALDASGAAWIFGRWTDELGRSYYGEALVELDTLELF